MTESIFSGEVYDLIHDQPVRNVRMIGTNNHGQPLRVEFTFADGRVIEVSICPNSGNGLCFSTYVIP